MKSYYILILVVTNLLILQGCAPISTCASTHSTSKLHGSKRLKKVIAERDSLCHVNSQQQLEQKKLMDAYTQATQVNTKLENEIEQLNAKYSTLFDENITQADKFSAALKMKSDELNLKEIQLAEREQDLKGMKSIISRQDSITNRLNEVLRKALLGFKSDELSVEIKNGKVYISLSDKLLFKSGSATVEDNGKNALRLVADVLQKNADIDILIEGHTDNDPIKTTIYKDNWDLSVGRATSIVRILTDEYHVSPKRVTASGKGEFYPKASNETPEGKAKNRRTEIILSPKLNEIMDLLNSKKN